jgi:hypothetical protein
MDLSLGVLARRGLGACSSGSTARPGDATKRASGGVATTSTRSAEPTRKVEERVDPGRTRSWRGGGHRKRLLPKGVHATFKLKAATPYPSGVVGLH